MSQFPEQPYGAPAKKSSGGKILLIIFGVLGVVGILGCGCCGGMIYFGLNAAGDAVKQQYGDHELVVEHIGEINSIRPNFQESEKHSGAMVFDVKGSKASGQIIVSEPQGDQFSGAELHINGEIYDLDE